MNVSESAPLVWYMTQAYAIRGGHEAHLLHFATELRRHGFETRVRVLDELPRDAHRFMRLLQERAIPLDALRRTRGIAFTLCILALALPWGLRMVFAGRAPDWGLLRNHIADRLAARALRRRVAREQPAIIHIMGRLAAYAWPALPAARCVLHHGTEGRRDPTWDAAEFEAFRAFAGRAARNFAPGAGVAENVRREFQIARPLDVIFTICPELPGAAVAAAAAAAPPSGRPVRFGMVCRMTPEKGIHALLEALRRFTARRGIIDFVIAGGGALEDEVRRTVATEKLSGVRVLGAFESPVEILRDCDVFVHPSLSDAMPLAIAEALMCGLPCIVTRVGGIPDLVCDGQEGLLLPPGDPGAILAALERFADMPVAERATFARNARARYEDACRPDKVGAIIAAHYRAMLQEKPSHA